MGAILFVGGAIDTPELDERLARMVRRSPYRGQVTQKTVDGFRVAVQSLGWDASLAVTPSHIVAVHGFITNLSKVATGRGLIDRDCQSPADRLASLAAGTGGLPVGELRGEFSLMWLDRRDRRLRLVRDAIGLRPLHYSIESGVLILGSEIRQVTAGLERTPSLNERRILEYLLRCPHPTGETVMDSVKAVRPARVYDIPLAAPERAESKDFWSPPAENNSLHDPRELAEELKRLLFQAVVRSLPDESIGLALSGGLDSASILSILTELEKGGAAKPERIRCYSLVYPGKECDESELITILLDELNRGGTFIDASIMSPMDLVPIAAARVDDCFVPVLYQLMPLCEAMRNDDLGIMLTGVGGDEWLFGHWSSILDDAWRGHMIRAIRDFLAMEQQIVSRRALLRGLLSEASARWRRRPMPAWLHPSRTPIARSMSERTSPRFPFARNQQLRMLGISQNGTQILPQEQLAASLGIEMRSPFMDVDLVDFSFTLPGRCLTGGKQHKRLLRDAIGSLLPSEIAERPRKTHFDSLLDTWLPPTPGEVSEWHLVHRRLIKSGVDEHRSQGIEYSQIEFARLAVAETIAGRQG